MYVCQNMKLLYAILTALIGWQINAVLSDDVRNGRYPHHVSITYKGKHICSGSIINNRHIITSKLCIVSSAVENLDVIVGINSLIQEGQLYRAEAIIKHDEPQTDLALIRTYKNITFTNEIKSIKIAKDEIENYESVKLIAWLKPFSGPPETYELQAYDYESYDETECEKEYNYFDNKQYICLIKSDRVEICRLDLGGGIVANDQLIGIKLYGSSCVGSKPEIHLRIYNYLDWIVDNSKQE